jgi:diacylglycerol kinase (ATP)
MSNKSLGESFYHAFQGLSHVLWTQRHVRLQLFMVMLVLLLAYVMHLGTFEVLFLLSAITFVLVAELFNTAVEVVVNMVTETYHPLAKIAKDVAAAAVLIASIYALLVGGAIFLNQMPFKAMLENMASFQQTAQPAPVLLFVLVGFGVVSIIVALAKIRKGHGSILRGGAVSGHSAVAFLLFSAILIYSKNLLVSIIALALAVLVAQSRVEGKIHTVREVFWGAIVALAFMALLLTFPHIVSLLKALHLPS